MEDKIINEDRKEHQIDDPVSLQVISPGLFIGRRHRIDLSFSHLAEALPSYLLHKDFIAQIFP